MDNNACVNEELQIQTFFFTIIISMIIINMAFSFSPISEHD